MLLLAGGGIKSFGDARSYGSTHHQSVVGVDITPSDKGYTMFLSYGAVKAYGDAKSLGSVRGETVTAGAIDSSGNGYYLLSADGDVHHFGKATYFGSTTALGYALVPAAIAVMSGANGYLEVRSRSPSRSRPIYSPARRPWCGDLCLAKLISYVAMIILIGLALPIEMTRA